MRFWRKRRRDTVTERAAKVRMALMADPRTPSYLRESPYAHAVNSWALAEAKVQLLREWVREQDLDPEQHGRRWRIALDELHKAMIRATNLRVTLGIRWR